MTHSHAPEHGVRWDILGNERGSVIGMLKIIDLTGTHARYKQNFKNLLTKNTILHHVVDPAGEKLLNPQRHVKNAVSFLGGFGTQRSARDKIAVVVRHESGEGFTIHLLSENKIPSGVNPISLEEFKAYCGIA